VDVDKITPSKKEIQKKEIGDGLLAGEVGSCILQERER